MRSTREVYANHYIRVLEDEVTRPDGSAGIFGLLEVAARRSSSYLSPRTTRSSWCTATGYTTGDVVGGAGRRQRRGGAAAAGERELAEETGYVAGRWDHLGWQWGLNGVARSRIEVFLARDLTRTSTTYDESEGIGAGRGRSRGATSRAMLRDGSLNDNESAGALLLAAIELGWA